MKKLLIALALGLSVTAGYSQGILTFNTLIGGSNGYSAPIFGVNPANPMRANQGQPLPGQGTQIPPGGNGTTDYAGHPLLTGTGFTAQLWGGLDAASLAAPNPGSGTRGFAVAPTIAGHLSSGVTAQYMHGAGTVLTLQVRAWDNRNNTVTSWAMVLADNTVPRGLSTTFLGPALVVAPTLPVPTPGMTSFNLFIPVPEPSVIALGALGLGALLLRRFRR